MKIFKREGNLQINRAFLLFNICHFSNLLALELVLLGLRLFILGVTFFFSFWICAGTLFQNSGGGKKYKNRV